MTDAAKRSWRHDAATFSKLLLCRLGHVQCAAHHEKVGRGGAFDIVDMYPVFQIWQVQAALQVGVRSVAVKAPSIGDENLEAVISRFAAPPICERVTLFETWTSVVMCFIGWHMVRCRNGGCPHPLTASFEGELVGEAAAISKRTAEISDIFRHPIPAGISVAMARPRLPCKEGSKRQARRRHARSTLHATLPLPRRLGG